MNYRPEIDGLRAIAIIPVVLFHAGIPGFSGGYLGVDIFFVISGYLITSILLADLASDKFSFKHFYERRARRILPALFAVMIACIPFAWILLTPEYFENFLESLIATSLFSSNILFWLESGYFDTETELKPLLHTWSLAVEEQYYLFFPLVLLLAWKSNKNSISVILTIIFISSLLFAEYISEFADAANFYLLPSRAWELMAGAIIAHTEFKKGVPDNPKLGSSLSTLGLALILLSIALFSDGTRHPSLYTVLPVLGTVLVIKYGHFKNLVHKFLANKVLLSIGLISYSLYLWHQPLIAYTKIYQPFHYELSTAIYLVATSVLLAYLSWRFIERPFRNPLLFTQKRIFVLVTSLTVILVISAIALRYANNFIDRFPREITELLDAMESTGHLKNGETPGEDCNYEKNTDINEFINRWDCFADKGTPNVLVAGDSHAADKAWALRTAGYSVGQMTGNGCNLFQFHKSEYECKIMFDKVISLAKQKKIRGIVLAIEDDMSPQELRNLTKYWGDSGVPILIFGRMPIFHYFKRKLSSREFLKNENNLTWEYEHGPNTNSDIAALVAAEPDKYKFTYIDTLKLFCNHSSNTRCSPVVDGKPLLIDKAHLSEYGAIHLGSQLRNDPVWNNWLESIADKN